MHGRLLASDDLFRVGLHIVIRRNHRKQFNATELICDVRKEGRFVELQIVFRRARFARGSDSRYIAASSRNQIGQCQYSRAVDAEVVKSNNTNVMLVSRRENR